MPSALRTEFTRSLQATGVRSIAFVPLLLTDEGIGTIVLGYPEPGFRLSQKQRALVRTFADQAVIAIENARLFEGEQASKRERTEALEQLGDRRCFEGHQPVGARRAKSTRCTCRVRSAPVQCV